MLTVFWKWYIMWVQVKHYICLPLLLIAESVYVRAGMLAHVTRVLLRVSVFLCFCITSGGHLNLPASMGTYLHICRSTIKMKWVLSAFWDPEEYFTHQSALVTRRVEHVDNLSGPPSLFLSLTAFKNVSSIVSLVFSPSLKNPAQPALKHSFYSYTLAVRLDWIAKVLKDEMRVNVI